MNLSELAKLKIFSSKQQPLNQQSLELKKPKNEESKNSDIKSLLKFATQKSFSWWLVKCLSLGCSVYCSTILFQATRDNKPLREPEIGLIAVVVVVNSNILERLKEIQVAGVTLTLEPKIQANKTINQREAAALSLIAQIAIKDNKNKRKIFEQLVDDNEFIILEKIAKNESLLYKKELNIQLRHLRDLNFIESKSDKASRSISSLQPKDDLTSIYSLTEWGKMCYKLRPIQGNYPPD
jgi:hypothetical protein